MLGSLQTVLRKEVQTENPIPWLPRAQCLQSSICSTWATAWLCPEQERRDLFPARQEATQPTFHPSSCGSATSPALPAAPCTGGRARLRLTGCRGSHQSGRSSASPAAWWVPLPLTRPALAHAAFAGTGCSSVQSPPLKRAREHNSRPEKQLSVGCFPSSTAGAESALSSPGAAQHKGCGRLLQAQGLWQTSSSLWELHMQTW